MSMIRPAAMAGTFYPDDPDALRGMVGDFLHAATGTQTFMPKAILAPHAGYIYSGAVAASAYVQLIPKSQNISRVILLGPSHRVGFSGIASSSAAYFQTPLGNIALDRTLSERLLQLQLVTCLDEAHQSEHSLEVHLPFLQTVLNEFTLLPLVVGSSSAAAVAEVLNQVWGGDETLIVISSDLSHFLDYASAQATDRNTSNAIERLDPTAIGSHDACGHIPLGGLLLVAKQRQMKVETLDLRNSGDTAGDRDRVVGYGSYLFGKSTCSTTPNSTFY